MKYLKRHQHALFYIVTVCFLSIQGVLVTLAGEMVPRLKENTKTMYLGYEPYQIVCDFVAPDAVVRYDCEDWFIVEVDAKGVVTPVAVGRTFVYVTILQEGKTYELELEVNVKNPYILITNKTSEMKAGTYYEFEAKAVGIKDPDIVWYGSNPWAGTINYYTGQFIADYPGKIKITAKDRTSGKTSSCTIEILKGKTEFRIVNPLEEHWCDVSYQFKTVDGDEVIWSVSDTKLASIRQDGVFTAKKPGTVTVTATETKKGQTSSCTIQLKEIKETPPEVFKLALYDNKEYFIYGIKDTTYTEIRLPKMYNGKKVTELSYNAFKDQTQLKTIVIPNTIKWIPDLGVFEGCSALESVVILNRENRLRFERIEGCENLKEFIMPYECDIFFGQDCFCEFQYVKRLVLPRGLKELNDIERITWNCKNIEIVIPDTVTYLTMETFGYLTNAKIVIPASVTNIQMDSEDKYSIKNTVIVTPKNSAAEQAAEEFGFPVIYCD